MLILVYPAVGINVIAADVVVVDVGVGDGVVVCVADVADVDVDVDIVSFVGTIACIVVVHVLHVYDVDDVVLNIGVVVVINCCIMICEVCHCFRW